ncbi:hypothetical protein NIES267_41840 [Calothrix parasitica NIES-267]|uniref:Uncharacterized protein n=1 Tax=Calothrix parasitica NIES-267 TaxID=1973488 RepID=A0A1Z4LUE3_9CYAN|nr:hypothetical protein NIES267_41840 [Calothrix parasitica NIES-267]
MSPTTLQNLKSLFYDRPYVLRMFDLREYDLTGLESEALIKTQKDKKIFPEPVKFYATGRTGAGKTALGNSLLDLVEPAMESHGYQDCTNSVQYFTLKSNLQYFDLPGAGSDESYENINRAALGIKQLEEDYDDIAPVNEFKILNYTKCLKKEARKPQVETIKVDTWQSETYQKDASPDIILYVVAPHMQFIRGDRRYLAALLKSLKHRGSGSQVIFALNIHYTKEGIQKPTPQNIQDARNKITEIYQKFCDGETPLIAEIDCLNGTGFSQIAEFICRVLPQNKIGSMQQVLRGELKQFAKKERSRRYRQTLIYLASRFATYPVDAAIGKGILEEAYAAVCDYGVRIFRQEDAYFEAIAQLNREIDGYAAETKLSREEAIKIMVPEIKYGEVIEEVITGYNPVFRDETVYDTQTFMESHTESVRTTKSMAKGGLLGAGAGAFAASMLTPFAPVALGVAAIGAAAGAFCAPKESIQVEKPATRQVPRTQRQLVDVEPIKETVTRQVPEVLEKEKEVGKKYLQGGYPVIENILAIGLGIEYVDSEQDLGNYFDSSVKVQRQQIKNMLSPHKQTINQLAQNCTNPGTKNPAEEQIINILQQAVIS